MDKVLKSTKKSQMIIAQLDHIEKSIESLINSISKVPIYKNECKLSDEEVMALKSIPEEEIIKRRLTAIGKSINNIEKSLAKNKVGSPCHYEWVCTDVTCTAFGPPDPATGTAVCIAWRCIAGYWHFVCPKNI